MALKRIISYKKRIVSLGSMQDTGCLGLVHWDDPEGWYGEGGARGVQGGTRAHLWWIHVAAAAAKSLQSCPTQCDPTDGSP